MVTIPLQVQNVFLLHFPICNLSPYPSLPSTAVHVVCRHRSHCVSFSKSPMDFRIQTQSWPRIQWSKQVLCSPVSHEDLFPGLQVPVSFVKTLSTFLTFACGFVPHSDAFCPHAPYLLIEVFLTLYNSKQLEVLLVAPLGSSSTLPFISSVALCLGVCVCVWHFETSDPFCVPFFCSVNTGKQINPLTKWINWDELLLYSPDKCSLNIKGLKLASVDAATTTKKMAIYFSQYA